MRKDLSASTQGSRVLKNCREALLIILVMASVYLFLALFSFNASDPGWSHAVSDAVIRNQLGKIGAWLADIILYFFGYPGYALPCLFLYIACHIMQRDFGTKIDYGYYAIRTAGIILIFIGSCGLAWFYFDGSGGLPINVRGAGGILGSISGAWLYSIFGLIGSCLLLMTIFFVGVTLAGLRLLWLSEMTGHLVFQLIAYIRRFIEFLQTVWQNFRTVRQEHELAHQARQEREIAIIEEKEREEQREQPIKIEPIISTFEVSEREKKEKQEKQVNLFEPPIDMTVLPPLDLLDAAPISTHQYSEEVLEALSRKVELKLKDFGIEAEVVGVFPGPVITRFELQPAPGIKGSQIINLAKDLARSLSVISVRVVDIIPGKPVIGIEIPNEQRDLVALGDIFRSKEFADAESSLTLGLGKDISGRPVTANLGKMPHLLVAGTTGSGKSVALNAMILSLLYKATPKEVRLIMIDPKMLELSVYEGISHLLAPVVIDMKEAANALRWCVAEMERRYQLMAALGVRNIEGYNRKLQDAVAQGETISNPLYKPVSEEDTAPPLEHLPFIVVIVDELADMMMTTGKKVEELIARLAQKARAAGIHLILATQRPSVDVITGLIKANIPSRIAFQVSSKIDSRTILDQMGAETLLGHGDMLYLPPGNALPERIHGAFVDDHEVHQIVDHLKSYGQTNYNEDILNEQSANNDNAGNGYAGGQEEIDALYDEAVKIVTESRKASISYIQRRLKIGYNRAARMIEEMEQSGLVSPTGANGTREVLASPPPFIE